MGYANNAIFLANISRTSLHFLARGRLLHERFDTPMITQTRYTAEQVTCPPKRMVLMRAGIRELEQWLRDVAFLGIAELPHQGPAYWQERRARLVDAKLAGLANRIETLEQLQYLPDWQDQMALELGQLYLMCRAFTQLEALAPEGRDELLLQLGLTQKKDKVLASTAISDTWVLVGQRREIHPRWDLQRLWWQGIETGAKALLLEFSVQGQAFSTLASTGQAATGHLCYYPGSLPRRALFQQRNTVAPAPALAPKFPDIDHFLDHMATALAQNPFLPQELGTLARLTPIKSGSYWFLRDSNGTAMPLAPTFPHIWNVRSLSGGAPIDLALEWNGYHAWPLSLCRDGQWHPLHQS